MADRAKIKAEIRTSLGSRHAAAIRRQGKLPAVVYGHKEAPVAVALDTHEFIEHLHHGNRLFDVDMDGAKATLLVKDLQYDHLGKNVIHADMVRVDLKEKVTLTVSVELRGMAKGAAEGGILDQHLDHLEVECLVTEIPDVIGVSIKELGLDEAIHAGDVTLPAGVTLVTDPEALLVTCHVLAAAKTTEEMEAEAPTAPEVITQRAEEETE
ncbi:MAG: 50S ribosomal protein L25 [Phycisphaerae bacterium]|nr:50S ribosomal protein L25 [Phycisphaerae bacterium]